MFLFLQIIDVLEFIPSHVVVCTLFFLFLLKKQCCRLASVLVFFPEFALLICHSMSSVCWLSRANKQIHCHFDWWRLFCTAMSWPTDIQNALITVLVSWLPLCRIGFHLLNWSILSLTLIDAQSLKRCGPTQSLVRGGVWLKNETTNKALVIEWNTGSDAQWGWLGVS